MLSQALAASEPLTLQQLQAALADASPATTFRYLRQVPHLRSYSHNGRFYALADPERFDSHGLFSLGTVRFSRDRSLSSTLQRLVCESRDGYTQKELRALLHVTVHPLLRSATLRGHMQRETLHGVFVYLSCDPTVADAQRQARRDRQGRPARAADLDPWLVIEVLLALLHHPNSPPSRLARHLRGHSPPIRLPTITAVFQRFDLDQLVQKGGPAAC